MASSTKRPLNAQLVITTRIETLCVCKLLISCLKWLSMLSFFSVSQPVLDLCALKECSWILSITLSWFVLPMDVMGLNVSSLPELFQLLSSQPWLYFENECCRVSWPALRLVSDLFCGPVSTWQLRGTRRTFSPEFTNICFAKSFTRPSWRMCNNVESISFAGVKILIFINCLFYTFILGMSACLSCIILLTVKAGK